MCRKSAFPWSFYSDGTNPDDVVLTATVTIENAALARVTHGADISDAFGMRDTLTRALDDAVADARRTVARLAAHLAKVDTELAKTGTA
ncbi:hypothetical protein AB0N09_27980 [Streptomyces erythrochromogenes]|uniref:hypothetical protein n=1 Tax=Streptomyces erythrochromogenes TaxID=285574 RepID=UPI00342512FF